MDQVERQAGILLVSIISSTLQFVLWIPIESILKAKILKQSPFPNKLQICIIAG